MKAEPRIFPNKPVWVELPEIKRDEKSVWFKGRMGRTHIASIKDVERWRDELS